MATNNPNITLTGFRYWEDPSSNQYTETTYTNTTAALNTFPAAYYAACDAFVAAAIADLEALKTALEGEEHDWAATGNTYNGATPDADTTTTEAVETAIVHGAVYKRVFIVGDFFGITTVFYTSQYAGTRTYETRWIEDSPNVWHEEDKISATVLSQVVEEIPYYNAIFILGEDITKRDAYIWYANAQIPFRYFDDELVDVRVTNYYDYTRTSVDIFNTSIIEGNLPGDYTLEGSATATIDEHDWTTLTADFNVQIGQIPIGYKTFEGAYCLDLHLKKWGKFKNTFQTLVELAPMNVFDMQNFSYPDMGMTAGICTLDGKVYLFDHLPIDSQIRYGKIGYYRLGYCHFLETRVDFRTLFGGSITLSFSDDGRIIEGDWGITQYMPYETFYAILFPNIRARWMTLTISGIFDLCYMESRANISGRR